MAAWPANASASSWSRGRERPPGAERQHADRPVADLERHPEELRVAEPPVGGEVLGDQRRPTRRGRAASECPASITRPLRLSPMRSRGRTIVWTAVPARPARTSSSPSSRRKPALSTASRRAASSAMDDSSVVGRRQRADLGVDLEQRVEVGAPRLLVEEQARVVDGDGGLVRQRLQQGQLLLGVVVALGGPDGQRAEDARADLQRDTGRRGDALPPRRRAAWRTRASLWTSGIVIGVPPRARRARPAPRRSPASAGRPGTATGPGGGAQGEALAVVVEQPQARDAAAQQLDGGADDALEHLVAGQRRGQPLGQARQRLEPAALLLRLGQQRGAGRRRGPPDGRRPGAA